MIYVEEKDFGRQIKLLSFLADRQSSNVCAWLYPESKVTDLAGYEVTDNPLNLSPVTTYENGYSPKCTVLVTALNNSFGESYLELKKNCDSLALYKNNETSWLAATIGHEGMCLVQDDTLLNSLIQAGYSASCRAPDWW